MSDAAQNRPEPPNEEEAHDILAAEEFEIGTRDRSVPRDPSGRDHEDPHDVLAAEEYAMPAADQAADVRFQTSGTDRSLLPLGLLLAALVAFALLRRR